MNDIEKRIEELTNELNYHNHKYYVDDAPEISDFAFDKMLVELEQLEEKYPEYKKKNSPTVRVGGKAVKSFGEVHHDVPMLSQQKAFSKEEILEAIEELGESVDESFFEIIFDDVRRFLKDTTDEIEEELQDIYCMDNIKCYFEVYNINEEFTDFKFVFLVSFEDIKIASLKNLAKIVSKRQLVGASKFYS